MSLTADFDFTDRGGRVQLARELGTIEPGKRADLAILEGNPQEDIHNVRRVRWTVADGRMYEAAALWQIVRFR